MFAISALPKSLKYIFVLSRFCGIFPFEIVPGNGVLKFERKLIYIIFPFAVFIIDLVNFGIIFSAENQSDTKIFETIDRSLALVNVIVCLVIPLYNEECIRNGAESCLRPNFQLKFTNYRTKFIGIFVSISYMVARVVAPRTSGDIRSAFFETLENIVHVCSLLLLCFLLDHATTALYSIRDEITRVISREEEIASSLFILDIDESIRTNTVGSIGSSSETLRKKHFSLYKGINNLTRAFGSANVALTIRGRFSCAFYMYHWIVYKGFFHLVLFVTNFCMICFLLYSVQELKCEEAKLRCTMNELDTDCLNTDKKKQFQYLKKQIQLLNLKFNACGLFFMNMEMVIPILVTTGGYLLLFNEFSFSA